ncbi:hypothetical protein C1645_727075, partial [Glomus cerebriforme]
MSIHTKYSNTYIDWLEKSISDKYIKYYEYSDFNDVKSIGRGSFGIVSRATWKITNRFFALKPINNDKQILEQVVKELKLYKNVDIHENILQFYGITSVETDVHRTKKYFLVLEYADSGTLNNYLDQHFNELDWNDKFQLALQLASSVEYIHSCGIIHCDLHANNIFVCQKNIKLADFGLSKKILKESWNALKIFDVIPYIDPKSFNCRINDINRIQKYKLNEKSDVYSIGVLMWQISSGRQPFFDEGVNYDICLALAILNGKREEIINGTPIEYSNLYEECWNFEPNERPNIQKVVSILNTVVFPKKYDIFFNEEINDFLMKKCQPDSKLNVNNDDLVLENIISNINLLNISISSVPSPMDIFDLVSNNINNTIIDELIIFIIKKHDKDISFDEIKQFINQQILQLNQAIEKFIKWLSRNQDKSQYIWFLGLFYYYNIGVKNVNSIKAFELFSKAANNNYAIAQVYLAKCYYDGYGTEKNYDLAFDWCKKSVENGSIIGQLNLGYCYKLGIGTAINKEKAFQLYKIAAENENSNAQSNLGILYEKGEGTKKDLERTIYWYNRAAKNGNKVAQYSLGKYYELGKGIEKDEIKAFEFYKKSAEKGYLDAQFQLGYYYSNGIGTKVNKEKAFELYNIAAKKGHSIAQNNLGILYEHGDGTEKDLKKAIYWYNKATENGYEVAQYNLGNCYLLGIGVKKDETKAFECYEKSAEKGYLDAQFKFGYCYDEGIGTGINKIMAFKLYKEIAEKENGNAQMSLGNLYKCGQGTKKDLKQAVYWYQKAAENGNKIAQYNLEQCYKDNGIETDKENAFKLYKAATKKVCSIAQNHLETLYKNGEAIGKELKETFYWYNKASESGCKIAQCYLGSYYDYIVKNKAKAFNLYEKSAEKGYSDAQFQLGYYYDIGVGTEVNKGKAFKLYKIIAEKEYSIAQNNLGILYIEEEGIEKDLEKAIYWHNKAAKN